MNMETPNREILPTNRPPANPVDQTGWWRRVTQAFQPVIKHRLESLCHISGHRATSKILAPTGSPARAFSLVEVLAAITIIGVITFLAVPNIVRVKMDSEDNLARARAEAINMAIASYVQAVGTNAAQSSWSAAGSDSARYLLVRQYIAFSESSLSLFTPGGYTNSLPSTISPLTTKVTVTGPSGTISY
jgi:prepilin-type N-terminal cleavage/methylation domain-containing protein